MRNVLLGCLIFCLAAAGGLLYADNDPLGDARISGLGRAYTAVADDSNALFINPAGLRLLADTDLSLRVDLEDLIASSILRGESDFTIFNQPILNGEILYTANSWGIAAFTEYYLEMPDEHHDQEKFDINVTKFNSLQIGAAFGFGPLSLGSNLKLSKNVYEEGIPFSNSNLGEFGRSFVQDVLFGSYDSEPDESVTMGAGALLTMGSLSFGAYSDTFIDFMHGVDGEIHMNIESVYETLSVGAAYQSPAYDATGNYRPLQLIAAADIHHLGDNQARTLALGGEVNLRFLNFAQLALRAGYEQPLPEVQELYSGFNTQEATYAAGAGVVLPFIKIDGSLQIPDSALHSDDEHLTAQITFGFSL